MKNVFELDFRGRKIVVEQGEYAKQAMVLFWLDMVIQLYYLLL